MGRARNKDDRQASLDVSAERFRSAGHRLIDDLANLLEGMRERRVTAGLSVGEIRDLIRSDEPMPSEGEGFEQIILEMTRLLTEHSLYNGHPRFLGYVTSSPAPIGMLADLLAAAVNPNCGAWALSPVATEIEAQTVRWIAELLGYPAGCSGLLVSGGNVANHVGVYCALRSVFPRNSPRADGGTMQLATLYCSTETHTWVEKTIDMYGFPPDALRMIPVDASQRIRLDALESQLLADKKAGRKPVAVVGTAGTVSTGAMDPLPAMARLAREHGVWFHVDGAYGGFATLADAVPDDIHGLVEADSVAVDPHKWLYAPLEAGCALVRDPERHQAAYNYHPVYYHFSDEAINYYDLGPQNSRGFRALKVWMALKQAGRAGYRQMITEDISLARELADRLESHPQFQVQTCDLSIVTFRYIPEGYTDPVSGSPVEDYLNKLNKRLLERLEVSGEVFVSNAVIDGRHLLRSCIVNFRTNSRDVQAIPEIIARHGAQVHQELQKPDQDGPVHG